VPVIASPRREFRALVEHEENGMLITDQQGFGQALLRLHQAPELLARIALAAHETVLREHTVESRGDALAKLLLRLSAERQFHAPRPLPHLPAPGSQLP
jgi:glycosyltransferase involved in cell wall biosynthesis